VIESAIATPGERVIRLPMLTETDLVGWAPVLPTWSGITDASLRLQEQ
jgi:hypothetical protein